jgi:hypothetical protein
MTAPRQAIFMQNSCAFIFIAQQSSSARGLTYAHRRSPTLTCAGFPTLHDLTAHSRLSSPVLHTNREFSSTVSVSRKYFCLERSRSSRNASLRSSCLVSSECRPGIKSRGRERARAAVVLDSDFDGLRLSRRQLLKGRSHSRAPGINRWYEQKAPYAAAI